MRPVAPCLDGYHEWCTGYVHDYDSDAEVDCPCWCHKKENTMPEECPKANAVRKPEFRNVEIGKTLGSNPMFLKISTGDDMTVDPNVDGVGSCIMDDKGRLVARCEPGYEFYGQFLQGWVVYRIRRTLL